MTRPNFRTAGTPVAWLLSVAALIVWRVLGIRAAHGRTLPGSPAWIAAVLAAAIVAAVLVHRGELRIPSPGRRAWLARTLAPVAWLLAVLTGGLHSPGAVLLAGPALVLGWDGGIRRAIGFTGIGLVGLVAGHAALFGRPDAGALLQAAILLPLAGVLPVWQHERTSRLVERARQRSERLEGFLTGRPTPAPVRAAAPEEPRGASAQQEREDAQRTEVLARFLGDVRDAVHADEAIFWRWSRSGDALIPAAWSALHDDPARYAAMAPAPAVLWSAREHVVQCDGVEGGPQAAVAPVLSGMRPVGALSVSSAGGFALASTDVKEWLARYAAHLALVADLLDTRAQYGRQTRQSQALLRAAQEFQESGTTDRLGATICEVALQVSSGARSTLIRWWPDEQAGKVQSVSATSALAPGTRVPLESLVGAICFEGQPKVWEDATMLEPGTLLYGPSEPRLRAGSLGVLPLVRRDGEQARTVGAIVIEGDRPEDVQIRDLRNVRLLAALATASLDKAWQIDEVTARAHTDQLTGLSNRRHFDEQFRIVLARADRYSEEASLVVCDVDHFKRVNDTFGHEAGDAVLRYLAATLREGLRQDVDVLARFGGEEFVLLLPHTGEQGAWQTAERLRLAVSRRPVMFEGREIAVTASFGIATYPTHEPTRDGLFPAADRALYAAKNGGRNCVRIADSQEVPR